MKTLVIAFALTVALQIISDTIDDPTIRMIASVAAMVVAAYAGTGFNGFSFDAKTIMQITELPIKAMDIYIQSDLQNKTQALQSDVTKFFGADSVYKARTEEYTSILKGLNEYGLTTENIVDLNKNSDNIKEATILSPSMFRYLLIDSYRDYNTLYTSPIDNFFNTQNRVGMVEV